MGPRGAGGAGPVAFAVTAAFLWATYYAFVLGGGSLAVSALLVDPFLVGGAVLLLGGGVGRHGRVGRAPFRDPGAYARAGLLLAMQVAILAATYLAGAVDTALLSLVGDVAVTPLILGAVDRGERARLRVPRFLAGLLFATAGATLVVVAGAAVEGLHGWAWAIAPIVPLLVAGYFVGTARSARATPMPVKVGTATLVAGAFGVLLSPLLPGGPAGLVPPTAAAAGIVVALGITSFGIAPYLYFRAIERAGMVLPALLMTAIPVFTLALSVALFATEPPLLGLAGIPVTLLGCLLAAAAPATRSR